MCPGKSHILSGFNWLLYKIRMSVLPGSYSGIELIEEDTRERRVMVVGDSF